MTAKDPRWNLNTHYHRVFLDAVSAETTTAIDIGCGDGILTFDLADVGLRVVGIDPHADSIERARADVRATERTHFIRGDVFTTEFEPASFDLVAANAVLHHIDARDGLRRMRDLVRPGGVVAVVGFGRPDSTQDRILEIAGAVTKRVRVMRGRYWEHNAPISWPPPCTMSEMQHLGQTELPGATFRRLMANRFALVWRAPLVEQRNTA